MGGHPVLYLSFFGMTYYVNMSLMDTLFILKCKHQCDPIVCSQHGVSGLPSEYPLISRCKDTLNTCPTSWFVARYFTLGNRYGFWPQTGCVTVPGREAAFLVARQRFPYRSRFNFSVKNMENMLPCNAICEITHIDFSRKMYCGANDASIGF